MFNRLGNKLHKLGQRLGIKKSGNQSRLGNKSSLKLKKQSAQEGMTSEEKTSAKIAGDAYEKTRKSNIDGFEYRPEHSDSERAVYHNKTTGHTRIGYKGTDSLKDLRIDTTHKGGNIVSGSQENNPMYKKDLEHFDKVKSALKSKKMIASGHSLGGSRTFNVSKNKNITGHAFNTGRGVDKQMKIDKKNCNSPNPPPHCDKMTSLRTGNDPLSYMNKGAYGKHKQFKAHSFNAHSMDNFSK